MRNDGWHRYAGLEDGGGHHGAASLILQPVLQVRCLGDFVDNVSRGSGYRHKRDKLHAEFDFYYFTCTARTQIAPRI